MNLQQTKPKTITNKDEECGIQNVNQRIDKDWLRNLVLETNDGLFCTASLMIGVCALTQDHVKAIIMLSGLVGIALGACIKALGVFMSSRRRNDDEIDDKKQVVRPLQSALASSLAFSTGAMIPMIAVVYMESYVVRLGVVAGVVSLLFAVFGWFGAFLGGASRLSAGLRVLIFGWVAMAIALGLVVIQW